MPGNFEELWSIIKAHEVGPSKNGGLVDHPADPGGLTKWGVSFRFLQKIWPLVQAFQVTLSFPIPISNEPQLCDLIRNLTEEQAKEIYFKCWWEFFMLWRINDAKTAYKIADMAINMGPPTTKSAGMGKTFELVQKALNAVGKECLVNGLFTPYEVGLINECEPEVFLKALCEEHRKRYEEIVVQNPSQQVFLKGWLKRAKWPY